MRTPAFLLWIVSLTASLAAQMVETAVLTPSTANGFGLFVAMDDDVIVSASRGRSAYVFERSGVGWASAMETAELMWTGAGDRVQGVAVAGDTVVLCVQRMRTAAVHVYEKPATGWSGAQPIATLTRSQGDLIATALAFDGETIAVGRVDPLTHGRVFLFEKPASGWVDATETAVLAPSDLEEGDEFGASVAVVGDFVVAGSEMTQKRLLNRANSAGAAYVFQRPSSGWVDASETAKLVASDGQPGDRFGASVSIDANTIVVGASWAEAAYVFEQPASGWVTATEAAKLTDSSPSGPVEFGSSVCVVGDRVVVGAPGMFLPPVGGSIHVFEKGATGWSNVDESLVLSPEGAPVPLFGYAVAASSDTVSGGVPVLQSSPGGFLSVYEAPDVVPESGCGLGSVVLSGSVRIGRSLDVAMDPCAPGLGAILVVGSPRVSPISLPKPVGCDVPTRCVLSCDPVFVVAGPVNSILLPNDPGLVGVALCSQGLCAADFTPCLGATDMVTLRVTN